MSGRDPEIQGHCDERYLALREAFAEGFRQGQEVGASLAVTEGGRYVVDLWGGYADAAKTRPWEKDTLVMVWSSTKIMLSLCALMLVDRGQLDLDASVADYWPEFAQAGKEKVRVRHLLDHSAGLPSFPQNVPFEALYDWDRIVEMLASQAPWWEPGTATGYHSTTMGFLVGELVRRVTGASVGRFFRTEVAEPLDADFRIGLPKEHRHRLAELVEAAPETHFDDVDPESVAGRFFANEPDDPQWSSDACQDVEIPSVNGHGNARSMARVGSLIAMGGELDGIRLLSRATLDKALEEQSYRTDLIFLVPIRFGLGMGLASAEYPMPHPNTLHWGGKGGSFCIMDLDAGVCCAYAMNNLLPGVMDDPRNVRIQQVLFGVMRS
jgi:CubicO group peptidase (beta-lactamase class C family)